MYVEVSSHRFLSYSSMHGGLETMVALRIPQTNTMNDHKKCFFPPEDYFIGSSEGTFNCPATFFEMTATALDCNLNCNKSPLVFLWTWGKIDRLPCWRICVRAVYITALKSDGLLFGGFQLYRSDFFRPRNVFYIFVGFSTSGIFMYSFQTVAQHPPSLSAPITAAHRAL